MQRDLFSTINLLSFTRLNWIKRKRRSQLVLGVVTNGCGCHNYLVGNYEAHYDIISSHH